MKYEVNTELLKKIEEHLERLNNDIELIKADIMKSPDMRPVPGQSMESLEHQLAVTRGAAVGVSQVLNIIRNGDAYII